MKKDRIVYIDALRIIASFFVMVIHVSALYLYKNIGSASWQMSNFLDAFSRSAVPLFLMISGGFTLSRPETENLKALFTKRLPALLVPTFIWSLLFALINHTLLPQVYSLEDMYRQLSSFWYQRSSTHLGFMYTLIAITLISPFLYYITKSASKSIQKYAMVWGIIAFVLPVTLKCFGLSFPLNTYFPFIFSGYILYYFLGYFLLHKKISLPKTLSLLCFVLLGIAITLATSFVSIGKNEFVGDFYEYMTLPVLLASFFLYQFVKQLPFKDPKESKLSLFITKLGSLSGGAYFVHMFFVIIFHTTWYYSKTFKFSIIALPLIFIASYGFSFIVSQIPVLRFLLLGIRKNPLKK